MDDTPVHFHSKVGQAQSLFRCGFICLFILLVVVCVLIAAKSSTGHGNDISTLLPLSRRWRAEVGLVGAIGYVNLPRYLSTCMLTNDSSADSQWAL